MTGNRQCSWRGEDCGKLLRLQMSRLYPILDKITERSRTGSLGALFCGHCSQHQKTAGKYLPSLDGQSVCPEMSVPKPLVIPLRGRLTGCQLGKAQAAWEPRPVWVLVVQWKHVSDSLERSWVGGSGVIHDLCSFPTAAVTTDH